MEDSQSRDILLFDVCSEIAAKTGGIYGVIRSKADESVKLLGDAYACIGPFKPGVSQREFVETTEDVSEALRPVIDVLRRQGVIVHYGRWLVSGEPRTILLEPMNNQQWTEACREAEDYLRGMGIDKMKACDDESRRWIDSAFVFGVLSWIFLREFARLHPTMGDRIATRAPIAHFHEWLGSIGLLLLDQERRVHPERSFTRRLGTCFTSHATMLGRLLASDGVNVYQCASNYSNGRNIAEADRRGYGTQHRIERASAHLADVFTVVSDVTGEEARHLLDKEPDIITPNGLHIAKFALPHRLQEEHATWRARIDEFCRGYFRGRVGGGHNREQATDTIYVYTAGRYEFINKGYDVFIRALGRLDRRLREEVKQAPDSQQPCVVAFLIVPAPFEHVALHTYDTIRAAARVKDAANKVSRQIGANLLSLCTDSDLSDDQFEQALRDIAQHSDLVELRRERRSFIHAGSSAYPDICTHKLRDFDHDQIIRTLNECGLVNGPDNRVLVVFHPMFLDASSPLGMSYDQFMRGVHLGVFPSFYEPWGLTPPEAMACGVPCVTTNTSGFGRYVEQERTDPSTSQPQQFGPLNYWRDCLESGGLRSTMGVYVADRRYKSVEETERDIASVIASYVHLQLQERVTLRTLTAVAANTFDWSLLIQHYIEAHNLALRRLTERNE